MGRRLLVCTPFIAATLVGCLLHPGGRAAHRDGGADGNPTDGMHADGSSMSICAGAGTPVDPLTTSPCGSGSSTSSGSGNFVLTSQGGTLTASVTMGMTGCSWNIDDGTSFHGVVAHVTSVGAAAMMGQATLSLSNGGPYSLSFQTGSDGLMATGYFGTQSVEQPVTVPFCARIQIVQPSGSAAMFVQGQVDDGSGWQTVASDSWFPAQQTGQVTVGVTGMGVSATIDHLDYVAPDAP